MAQLDCDIEFVRKEAAENKLTERDPRYLERGLHEFEDHHPLMKGKTFREFWLERGFSNKEVERITVKLDKDIHRAISESGWWDTKLFQKIAREEAISGGETLSKQRILEILEEVLDEMGGWSPR